MPNLLDVPSNAPVPGSGVPADTFGRRCLMATSDRAVSSRTAAGSPYFMEAASPDGGFFWRWEPTDFAIAGRTTRMFVRAQAFNNSTAPGVTITIALHSMTGAPPVVGGAVAAGASVGPLTANSRQQGVSAVFDAPIAGFYCLGLTFSGTPAVNCFTEIGGQLYLIYA